MTPMMQQYMSIKAEHKDTILMFRLGDFYEIFFEDAKIASSELDIALTGREGGMDERVPMCGVPHHAVEGYITRLVEKGYRVAIADQVEDPKQAKGIVKREVVRIVTPGTITDAHFLQEGQHNYILAIHKGIGYFGLAIADITTGLFVATSMPVPDEQQLMDEIARLNPAELLISESFPLRRVIENMIGCRATIAQEWTFEFNNAEKCLNTHFGTFHLEGFGISERDIPAAGALLTYLAETQKNALSQITTIKPYAHQTYMILDSASRRNLELTTASRTGQKNGALLGVLDYTKTAMGARMLRDWVEQPLINIDGIKKRLNAVDEWINLSLARNELREYLHGIHDLERVMARICTGNGSARDLAVLCKSLEFLPAIEELLVNVTSEVNEEISRTYDNLSDIHVRISSTIVEAPPAIVREGGMIRSGCNTELDKLHHIKQNAQTYLEELEAREKKQTGINSLKVRYNKVFGYYIEVTTTNLSKVPDNYIRRQTLANAERFITEELKSLEDTLLGADEKINALEYELYNTLRREVIEQMPRIQFTAQVIATLDVFQSLAHVAERDNYAKPMVTEDSSIIIKGGRHPVVEKLGAFIPNDTHMDSEENNLAVITGPNMAGKSTYMRQVALIVLMAQIGSFVPADSAEIGIVDRIFTRVGASDDLATGQSTFMVEMTEVANILNNATSHSLVILDEIGRGTSTFDGLSIAWAVLEHIAKKIGSKTLFATHYHELTQLEGQIEGVVNFCFTAQEQNEGIVFLRQLIQGRAGQSYGIHVARLAGLPLTVLNRATKLLSMLNASDITQKVEVSTEPDPEPDTKGIELIEALSKIDVNKLTPMEAMLTLDKLKKML